MSSVVGLLLLLVLVERLETLGRNGTTGGIMVGVTTRVTFALDK